MRIIKDRPGELLHLEEITEVTPGLRLGCLGILAAIGLLPAIGVGIWIALRIEPGTGAGAVVSQSPGVLAIAGIPMAIVLVLLSLRETRLLRADRSAGELVSEHASLGHFLARRRSSPLQDVDGLQIALNNRHSSKMDVTVNLADGAKRKLAFEVEDCDNRSEVVELGNRLGFVIGLRSSRVERSDPEEFEVHFSRKDLEGGTPIERPRGTADFRRHGKGEAPEVESVIEAFDPTASCSRVPLDVERWEPGARIELKGSRKDRVTFDWTTEMLTREGSYAGRAPFDTLTAIELRERFHGTPYSGPGHMQHAGGRQPRRDYELVVHAIVGEGESATEIPLVETKRLLATETRERYRYLIPLTADLAKALGIPYRYVESDA